MMSSKQNDVKDELSPLGQLGSIACDHYHHFYHYQASAQYLWLAEVLRKGGNEEEVQANYHKALFQDHYNIEALTRKEVCTAASDSFYAPTYDKHPISDKEFCASTGQAFGPATEIHDQAVMQKDTQVAYDLLTHAIAQDATHSNSYFARGKIACLREEYTQAAVDFREAIRLSHLAHDAYHRFASYQHFLRGQAFWQHGELDLAIADYSKALDLWSANPEARQAKEKAYKIRIIL